MAMQYMGVQLGVYATRTCVVRVYESEFVLCMSCPVVCVWSILGSW